MSDATALELPRDVDLEQAIIGACIADNRYLPALQSHCPAETFFCAPHPDIVSAMLSLETERREVTPLTVQAKLGRDIGLDISSHDYLAGLALAAPAGNPVEHMRSLADMAQRRDTIIAMRDSEERLKQGRFAYSDATREVLETIDRCSVKSGAQRYISTPDAIDEMLRRAQDSLDGKPLPTITTGLRGLDDAIGGLHAGDLCVFAGRPGMGKSSLLLCSALAAARNGHPVLFFSLEMTREQLLHRAACDLDFDDNRHDPLSYSWFRRGDLRPAQVERLAQAARRIPHNLTVHDDGDLTIHDVASIVRERARRETKMGLVVIDYIQKLKPTNRYAGNRVQEVTEATGAAKALAKRVGWPVLVGAQLNRGVETRQEKRPELSDLRESGSIEQDADQVIGLYRKAYYIELQRPADGASAHVIAEWEGEYVTTKHRLDLLVLKNRHGAQRSIELFCDMRASAIRDGGF